MLNTTQEQRIEEINNRHHLYNSTAIGHFVTAMSQSRASRMVKVSAIKVNRTLLELGYLERNGDSYEATPLAVSEGYAVNITHPVYMTTIVKWHYSIANVIISHLLNL